MPVPSVDLLRDACEGFSLTEFRRLVWWHLDAIQTEDGGGERIDPNWPEEFVDICINIAYGNLQQQNMLTFEGASRVERDFPLSAGSTSVELPGNLWKVDRVLMRAGVDFYPLRYENSHFTPEFGTTESSWYLFPTYRVEDWKTIRLNPAIGQAATIKVFYYALPKCLRTEKERPDSSFLQSWHHLVALEAAVVAKAKTQDDPTQLKEVRDRVYTTFVNALDQKSAAPKFIEAYTPGGYIA